LKARKFIAPGKEYDLWRKGQLIFGSKYKTGKLEKQ